MSKPKLTKILPTDRIGFTKQQDIIKAYLIAFEKVGSVSVSNEDVAQLVGMKASTVSMLNAFLVDAGFIIRSESGKYTPSSDLVAFSKSLDFDPANAWTKLSSLVNKTWFAQEIVPRLKMKELEESEALTFLAVCSNADKDQSAQLKMLLDYMSTVGLIVRDGSKIKLASRSGALETPGGVKGSKNQKKDPPDDDDNGPPESYTLVLGGARKVIVQSPPAVTQKELKRIQDWLALQLIVSDEEDGEHQTGGAPPE